MPSRILSQVSLCEIKPCVRFSCPQSRYVVRFPDSSYLLSYTDSGTTATTRQNRARVFRDRSQAEDTARILSAEVWEIPTEKKLANPFRSNPSQFVCCQIIVELGGGQFAGVWPPIKNRSDALVLFNSKVTGTTLACLLPELSAEVVRLKIAASDAAFGTVQP